MEMLIETMHALPGLWIATAEQVAAHVRGLRLAPRAFPQPVVDPRPREVPDRSPGAPA
jgi:hypothetical protein